MRSREIFKLLEETVRRFENFRLIGVKAAEMKQDVVLHPMEWWEPGDQAHLEKLQAALKETKAMEPLPFAKEA